MFQRPYNLISILDGGLILRTGSFDKSGAIFTENPVNCGHYMQIFARTLTGKNITIDINQDDPIGWLKMKIQKMCNIQPKLLRLLYSGKQLDHDIFTLRDYKMQREASIHILVRCLGN